MEKATAYMTLWSRCNVSPCVFCTMGNPKKNLEPREYGIWKNVNEIACKIAALDWDKYDKISFVGGEALSHEEPTRPVEPLFRLVQILSPLVNTGKLKKVIFSSSFKFSYRGSILEMLAQEIMHYYPKLHEIVEFNTSWDLKFRFFGSDKAYWSTTVSALRSLGFRVHASTICSQNFIKAYTSYSLTVGMIMKDFPGDHFDLIPALGKKATLDPMADFFPKRSHFLDFLEVLSDTNAPAFMRLVDQFRGTANVMYSQIGYSSNPRRPSCGHLPGLKNYDNSCKCAMCDIEEFLKTFKEGNK